MRSKPTLIAMDLEGVLVPEIWIAVAEKTGIRELYLTTRDISDYDRLMKGRLKILGEHRLSLKDIQAVIGTLDPLPGAFDFLNWLRCRTQVIILTDSYYEFVDPLMNKLDYPTHFCNTLEIDQDKMIVDYRLRQQEGKKHAVLAFRSLGFRVIAIGDSYNDTTMLAEADKGILFRPSEKVVSDFPQFPVTHSYEELRNLLSKLLKVKE